MSMLLAFGPKSLDSIMRGARLEAMRAQLLASRLDAQPCVTHAGWQWRRHAGLLCLEPAGAGEHAAWSCPWDGAPEVQLGAGRGRVLHEQRDIPSWMHSPETT
jgi:hypothetical protein